MACPTATGATGEWLVVEADESDRSLLELEVELAVLTNVELDHHTSFGSLQELREVVRAVPGAGPMAVIWDRPELLALRDGPLVAYDVPELALLPDGSRFRWHEHEVRLSVPGVHNALNAAGRARAGAPARRRRGRRDRGAGPLSRRGPALSAARRERHRGARVRRLRPPPERDRRDPAGREHARAPPPGGRLPAAPVLAHAALAGELGRALAAADVVAVLDVYPARERAEDFPGVSGLLVAESAADAAAGRPVYWLPDLASAGACSPAYSARATCAW